MVPVGTAAKASWCPAISRCWRCRRTARSSIRSSGFGTICAVTGSPTRCFPAWRTSSRPARWPGTGLPTTPAWSARSARSPGLRLHPLCRAACYRTVVCDRKYTQVRKYPEIRITGQVYSHVCTGTNGCGLAVGSAPTSTAQLEIQGPAFAPYQPASMDANQAEFWTVSSQTFEGVDSKKTPIPSHQWAWAYCPSGWPGTPNPNWICLKNATFNPSLLYEMAYTAKNPLVLGVGFAAFRDLGSFLRYEAAAPGGGSNPISGTVKRTYTVGSSQSGPSLHGFIFWGFNQDENGRTVFDGAWPQIDGRMMVMNIRWGQPNNLMYLYMGGDEAPVWWADYPNLARRLPPNGMLHRCAKSNTCPQILETFASAELYSEKFSASLCGFTCIADIPLPLNVHRYYSPGATHGGGNGSFTWAAPGTVAIPAGQSLPNDPIPETFTNDALTYAFIQLLMSGTPMPPSVYPTLARGELVPNTAAAEGFPNIPDLPYHGDQAWPPFVYDFGPERTTTKRVAYQLSSHQSSRVCCPSMRRK